MWIYIRAYIKDTDFSMNSFYHVLIQRTYANNNSFRITHLILRIYRFYVTYLDISYVYVHSLQVRGNYNARSTYRYSNRIDSNLQGIEETWYL